MNSVRVSTILKISTCDEKQLKEIILEDNTYRFPFLNAENLSKVIFPDMKKAVSKRGYFTENETIYEDDGRIIQHLECYHDLLLLDFTTTITQIV